VCAVGAQAAPPPAAAPKWPKLPEKTQALPPKWPQLPDETQVKPVSGAAAMQAHLPPETEAPATSANDFFSARATKSYAASCYEQAGPDGGAREKGEINPNAGSTLGRDARAWTNRLASTGVELTKNTVGPAAGKPEPGPGDPPPPPEPVDGAAQMMAHLPAAARAAASAGVANVGPLGLQRAAATLQGNSLPTLATAQTPMWQNPAAQAGAAWAAAPVLQTVSAPSHVAASVANRPILSHEHFCGSAKPMRVPASGQALTERCCACVAWRRCRASPG